MEILLMLIFISVLFFITAAVGFAFSVRSGEAAHSDRLAALPFHDDDNKEKT